MIQGGATNMIHVRIIWFMFGWIVGLAGATAATALSQQVVINTGMPEAVYMPGTVTEGDPVIVPALTNRMKITLDRANMGPGTEQTIMTVRCQEFDGVSWNNCGAFSTFGGCTVNPFGPGCMTTSVLSNSPAPSIEPRTRRVVVEVGGPNPIPIRTNSAFQMWEVK